MSNINFTYTNLTPFKWYVLENFPFIEADFDALTNWQLFCKLGKEMNKIINSVNVSGHQVETLTTAFNNLQNYVNNYFSELNVQDEINNKLDEMVKNGTFESILEPFLNSFNTKISTQNEKINTLEQRMNGFTNLPDGSTSGDAELNDIKIGFHQTFETPGESVRKQIENVMQYPFEGIGGASKYIKYVKIIGLDPSKRLVISNIQNKYVADTSTGDYAFYLFPSDDEGNSEKENGIRINLPNIAGYYKIMLNILGENVTLSVLYDLSSLPENTRYTEDGYETLIRQDCYIPSSYSTYFELDGGASKYIKYVKIIGLDPSKRLVISNIQNKYVDDTSTGDYAFYLFPSDDEGNSEKRKRN